MGKVAFVESSSAQGDEDNALKIMKMIAALEDDDDVQNVFANFEVSEDVMRRLTAACRCAHAAVAL